MRSRTSHLVGAALLVLIGAGWMIVPASHAAPAAAPMKGPARELSPTERARQKWESVILFFGDEETGEWSLRLRDQDVHERGWFEFLELWQLDPKTRQWHHLPTEKIAKAVVKPKEKGTDEPDASQTLIEFKDIPPRTAGLWYAKWRMDGIDGATLMRVGTASVAKGIPPLGDPPEGMIKMAVPIDLNKSEAMLIPDPRLACVQGKSGADEEKSRGAARPKDGE